MEHFKLISVILLFSTILAAQPVPDNNIDNLIWKGIDQILMQNYDEAETIFIELEHSYPGNPLGKVYQAAVEMAKGVDYEEKFNNAKIMRLLEGAEQICDSLLDVNDEFIWNKYYAALTSGYLAYFYALNGNYIVAFSDGLKSINMFEDCLEVDPEFYEAYIAFGTYKYWKSKKADVLNFLSSSEDNTNEAIKLLQKSIDEQTYNKHLAINSLIWVYIEENKSRSAVKLAKKALEQYPESRFFKWGLARAYEDYNKQEAILAYLDILHSHMSRSNSNGYNEIVLKHKIAMLLNRLGRKDEAMEYCRDILQTKLNSDYVKARLEDRLERVQELWNKLIGSK